MFPSTDPFAYPLPPMTTLEQNFAWNNNPQQRPLGSQPTNLVPGDAYQQGQQHPLQNQSTCTVDEYNRTVGPTCTANPNTVSADDHIDAQLFGPLPPYLQHGYDFSFMPHGQQSHHQQPRGYQDGGSTMNASGNVGDGGAEHGSWEQMQGLEGFGYEDIFGNEEEWRGTMF